MLRRSEGEDVGFSSVALLGGVSVRGSVVGGDASRGQIPVSLDPFCQLPAGCSARVPDTGGVLVAVPFLPDRPVCAAKRDLSGCAQDGCSAGLAGLGRFRGRAPRTTALRHTPAGLHISDSG